ncbi:RNA-directed DNA polymerase, eukaryota, reverse transcriptase zinc-binding domain protein [Tanacetum coccineum]
MFSIGDERAPGPDGFSSAFFKKGWDIVGLDVCHAIRDFFINGIVIEGDHIPLLLLSLRFTTPLKINDYRPISCCNVIYKCISKILTNRIIDGIKEVVSDNQSAFVPGRRISDNILITQELMHNYHRNRGPPRWKRGLRQGDPLSPYLFTLIMEVLTLMIKRRVNLSGVFRYHKHCEELQLVNVCFADDLFIFARGDLDFCRISILNIMPFAEGNLPVKYLGVPLISSRLLNKDCKVLVEEG